MYRDRGRQVSGSEAAMIYLDRLDEIRGDHNRVTGRYDALEGALLATEGGLVQFTSELADLSVPEDIHSAQEEVVRAVAGLRRVLEKYQQPSSL